MATRTTSRTHAGTARAPATSRAEAEALYGKGLHLPVSGPRLVRLGLLELREAPGPELTNGDGHRALLEITTGRRSAEGARELRSRGRISSFTMLRAVKSPERPARGRRRHGRFAPARRAVLWASGCVLLFEVWWRKAPSPWPYRWRALLYLPLPAQTRSQLCRTLAPRAGERLLEVGPGVGSHALAVAAQLQPDGELAIVDIQQEMLDHVVRRARRHGLTNIVPQQGDACSLPYADASFDGAYLLTTLGETRAPETVLAELGRVLKPGGRLVVGEFLINPSVVAFAALRRGAGRAGLRFERRVGTPLSYLARFVKETPEPEVG